MSNNLSWLWSFVIVTILWSITHSETVIREDNKMDKCQEELEEGIGDEKKSEVLMLGWREFNYRLDGDFKVADKPLVISEVANSGQGTGLNIWDGAILLSKFMEQNEDLRDKKVLELGSGTGVVGLACAYLGASNVYLTDLDYTLQNINKNIKDNHLEQTAHAMELDWMNPDGINPVLLDNSIDYIVGADVVWVPELVPHFVSALKTIIDHNRSVSKILIAHQTRSLKTDQLLFDCFTEAGLTWIKLDKSTHHPQFYSVKVDVYQLFPSSADDQL